MARWRGVLTALATLAWSVAAGAQNTADGSPIIPHPVFLATTLGGEVGGVYDGGAKLAVLATPFSRGISLGGSAFVAPLTAFEGQCSQPCSQHPILFRGQAELRLGTAYREAVSALFWIGLSAGVAYLDAPQLSPGPMAAVALGQDVRLIRLLWFEYSFRLIGAQIPGPAASFGGTYFTFGIEVGTRLDLAR